MKKIATFLVMFSLAGGLAFCDVYPDLSHARPVRTAGQESGIMLDLQKISLGTLPSSESKKQYITAMMIEKEKILNFTLRNVYENAYEMYKRGDYQRAYEMCITILGIDPDFKEADTLAKMASRMGVYGTTSEAKIIDQKYKEAMMFYNTGRLPDAKRSLQEVLVIKPNHPKANYWAKRIDREIAGEYERRGDEAFKKEEYERAIEHWYDALLILKKNNRLVNKIAKAENVIRKRQINDILTVAVQHYNQGDLIGAYNQFAKALEIQPKDKQILRLAKEVSVQISQNYFATAKQYYSQNQYTKAIENYEYSLKWGYSSKIVNKEIKRARSERSALIARRKEQERIAREKKFEEDLLAEESQAEAGSLESELYETEVEEIIVPIVVDEKKVSEQAMEASQNLYREGLKYFNDGDFERAREKFLEAVKVDPGNKDAEAGLERIKSIFGE